MEYKVSALKYRPDEFDKVIGQNHVTDTLKNSIKENKIPSAILFCGPKGVGKTTCARIYAKEINKISNKEFIVDKLPLNFRWIGFIIKAVSYTHLTLPTSDLV